MFFTWLSVGRGEHTNCKKDLRTKIAISTPYRLVYHWNQLCNTMKEPLIRPFSISEKGQVIDLLSRRYHVYILGGWGVKVGGFVIQLKHISTGEVLQSRKALVRTQAYAYNKRAKRVFVVEVENPGKYEVSFVNVETLEVKRSNLPIFSSFMPTISHSDIQILVTEKTGWSPVIA